jgi:hypothetical protein
LFVKRCVSGRDEEKSREKVFREPPRPVLSLFFAAQVPSLARQKIEYYRRTTDTFAGLSQSWGEIGNGVQAFKSE